MNLRATAAMAAACAIGATAVGAPRESVTYQNISSAGVLQSSANVVRQHTFAGGYVGGRVRVSGTLTEVNTSSYASDARVRVTTSAGASAIVQPFAQQSFSGSIGVAPGFSVPIIPPDPNAAGIWEFRFFEDIQDSVDNTADSRWAFVSFTLDDEAVSSLIDESDLPGADAGELPFIAGTGAGNGPVDAILGVIASADDADLYAIDICNPAQFRASIVTGSSADTQLWLFDSAGRGVAFNDDDAATVVQSTLTSALVASRPAGRYYLGVTTFDRDAVDASGQALWLDTPHVGERAPDAPGAANAITQWAGSATDSGAYLVSLRGVCFPATEPCVADLDNGGGAGTRDNAVTIDDLLYFIRLFQQGNLAADLDDGSGTGTPDGGVDSDDILFYLARFAAGC